MYLIWKGGLNSKFKQNAVLYISVKFENWEETNMLFSRYVSVYLISLVLCKILKYSHTDPVRASLFPTLDHPSHAVFPVSSLGSFHHQTLKNWDLSQQWFSKTLPPGQPAFVLTDYGLLKIVKSVIYHPVHKDY